MYSECVWEITRAWILLCECSTGKEKKEHPQISYQLKLVKEQIEMKPEQTIYSLLLAQSQVSGQILS